MRRAVLALALTLTAAVPLAAQQMPSEAPGKPDAARVTAGTYTVDPAHTQVLFTVNHLGFSQYTGQFTDPSGTLTLDPANPEAAKVMVTFPIDKVSTTAKALDEHLMKADFFDAEKYPEGKFVSTHVDASGRTATITGDLTLRGVTKPVVLKAEFIGAGPGMMGEHKTNIGFRATTQIKRSDFGIDYGIPLVSDRVDLVINAAFEKQ
ncbi:YceI family protein [Stakelama saccharophila]|uniref:YceI family protein n=1 Tax=Stakelama saccharophila TaxID=3075605 RepID=A0ABZ0B6Z9_9SPHN|nr:YceI family protein [Stakelama sp. W311]WNO52643.1 YceI family protein [Stakelama sp. W311]